MEKRYKNFKRRLNAIRRLVYTDKVWLDVEMIKSDEPILWKDLDKGEFKPVKAGEKWGRRHACAWLKLCGEIPSSNENPVVLIDIGKFAGEGLVYDKNGEVVSAFTNVWTPMDVPQSGGTFRAIELKKGTTDFELYADCGFNGFFMLDVLAAKYRGAFLASKNQEMYDYYYDFLALYLLLRYTDDMVLKNELKSALNKSYTLLNKSGVASAREVLSTILSRPSNNNLEVSAVGHGHLDLAWMWPIRETKRKAVRTLTHALNNIDKYPDYIFGTSQPQQLIWVKENYPKVYEKVKKAIIDGRIEMQGGFFVECDTNLPCGESLIRQTVYGTRFSLDEFGLKSRVGWLPDAFGYSGNLPQILKKSGMDYFSTIKLSWNKVNKFPYRTFIWEGIDGSEILVHMPPEGDYNSTASPKALVRAEKNYPEIETGVALMPYGGGDGGGGAGESHLELVKRTQNLYPLPKIVNRTASDFFELLSKKDIKSHHKGELYLETHQGTLTTQGKNKYFNRLCERLLHNAELLASFDFAKGNKYPHDFLQRIWHEVLLYQFHDIIPGSSITRVNEEARERYGQIVNELNDFIAKRLEENDGALCALNPTSFDRTEIINHNGKYYRAELAPYSSAPLNEATSLQAPKIDKNTIDNGIVSLAFNERGEICSYKYKNGRELCDKVLNRLTIYRDKFMIPFNAWDIDINYPKRRKTHLKATEVKVYTEGDTAIRESIYRYKKCTIKQHVMLSSNSDNVLFETEVDWHTKHRMLRADFFPIDYSDTAKFDIQFGHIERSTTENNSVEKAQFEVCAHKWVAVEGENGGFALLNDCKYGHRVKNNQISLNLLRSPVFPDKKADRGNHRFSYMLCPFESGNIDKVVREGYRLNNPLVVYQGEPIQSLASVKDDGVIIETIKAAQDNSGIIIRLYETLGKHIKTSLKTNFSMEEAIFTDMVENEQGNADLKELTFTPFEVKTIKLKGAKIEEQNHG